MKRRNLNNTATDLSLLMQHIVGYLNEPENKNFRGRLIQMDDEGLKTHTVAQGGDLHDEMDFRTRNHPDGLTCTLHFGALRIELECVVR